MRKKYDLKLVYDYIWGNDINEYSVDELEDDYSFMLQVMECSKDKRLYELCSDRVRCNYEFVKNIIFLFKNDLEFVTDVARTYIDSLSDVEKEQDIHYFEINVIMSQLYNNTINEFVLVSATLYEYERQRAMACLNAFEDRTMVDDSRNGFIVSAVEYEESPFIINFIAKKMISEAIYGRSYDYLERLIHSNFKSIEQFDKYGGLNFIQDCINNYDKSLASYAFEAGNYLEFEKTFSSILRRVANIKCNWPLYMDRVNEWRVNMLYCKTTDFMINNYCYGNLSYDDIVSYVANRLNVSEVFEKFEPEFSMYDPAKFKVLSSKDVLILNAAVNFATKLFESDVIIDDYDDDTLDAYNNGYDSKEKLSHNASDIVKFQLLDQNKNTIK